MLQRTTDGCYRPTAGIVMFLSLGPLIAHTGHWGYFLQQALSVKKADLHQILFTGATRVISPIA